jgi:hypothetical protein
MENRRKLRRSRVPYEINVYDKKTGYRIGRLVNLSDEGIMLVGGAPMSVNDIYECRMTLPIAVYGRREISFDALCLWCAKIDNSSRFHGGFQIQKSREEIRELLRIFSSTRPPEQP